MPKTSKKNSDEDQWRSDGDDDDESEGDQYSNDDSDGRLDDDDDDDNYSDYERGEYADEFNDEEKRNTRYAVSGRYTDDDDGETKQENYWWEGREKLIAAILLCWCCLCLIIIAVVLGVVLGRRNRDTVVEILPAPTNRPTFAPQPLPPSAFTPSPTESAQPTFTVTVAPTIRPTSRPTASPTDSFAPTMSIPEELDIVADQDTYVQHNASKEFQGEEYGHEDTFLVQNGPRQDELLPDAVGLITFPIEEVPVFSRIADMEKSAILRLTHVVSVEEHPSANYTIVRVPETKSAVEFFHGFFFVPPEDNATGVLVGPTFPVSPDDTVIDIDISPLLYNYTLDNNKKAKQLFLMIENRGPEQIEGGDRFYSRESNTPPQLLLNFNKQAKNASNFTQE